MGSKEGARVIFWLVAASFVAFRVALSTPFAILEDDEHGVFAPPLSRKLEDAYVAKQVEANTTTLALLAPSSPITLELDGFNSTDTTSRSSGSRGVNELSLDDRIIGTPETKRLNSSYAYAFLIGGCNPDSPKYRSYLYNVLNSAWLLRKHGSKADIVCFFQMSIKSRHTRLPKEDLRWLAEMNVKVLYIPKQTREETFYELQLNKFRILGLTEYRRVLYMDADSLPINNLDYLFKLSDSGAGSSLQPNVIVAGALEPANGGFFMLEPHKSALEDVTQIIKARVERTAKKLKGNPKELKEWNDAAFDKVLGWGHEILPPDCWESNKEKNFNWTFHAPFSDQGLLYYYAKYVRQNTSIILADRTQKWSTNTTTREPVMVNEAQNNPFRHIAKPVYGFKHKDTRCSKWAGGKVKKGCPKPYDDFVHFSGARKPWNVGVPTDLEQDTNSTPVRLWWSTLAMLNLKLGMGINDQLRNWTKGIHSPVGKLPFIGHSAYTVVDLGRKIEGSDGR